MKAHQKIIGAEKRKYYLHLSLFLANELKLNDQRENNLTNNPLYAEMFKHDAILSNLGYYSGVASVYSGHPPEPEMMVIGYIIEKERILVTFTDSRIESQGICASFKGLIF